MKPIVQDYRSLCKDKHMNNLEFYKYYNKKSQFLKLKKENIDIILNNNQEEQIEIKIKLRDVLSKLKEKEKEKNIYKKICKFKRMVKFISLLQNIFFIE